MRTVASLSRRVISSFNWLLALTLLAAVFNQNRLAAEELKAVANPETLGFDASKLEKIDQAMLDQIKDGKIVGCSALIFKDGKIAYARNWGKRDRKKDLPVEDDTIWRIYSMSKPITSVAVMQLVEKGKINLDDPIARFIPEFKDLRVFDRSAKQDDRENGNGKKTELPTVPANRPMTVRDLLRHTSGLTYGFFGDTPVDRAYRKAGILFLDADLQDMTRKLGKIPLLYQPGTRFHYSVSTDCLGRVVEVATGKSFKEYLQENIFDPLQMKDTFFTVPKAKQARLAELYRFQGAANLVPAPRLTSVRFVNEQNRFYSGGGGLCSTTGDYLRFSRMLLNGGELDGNRILRKKTVQEMTRNQLPKGAAGRNFQFGLGFQISPEGHFSWGGAAGTRFWVDPKNRMITIFMIQINPYRGGHGQTFKRLAYQALKTND